MQASPAKLQSNASYSNHNSQRRSFYAPTSTAGAARKKLNPLATALVAVAVFVVGVTAGVAPKTIGFSADVVDDVALNVNGLQLDADDELVAADFSVNNGKLISAISYSKL